jgi:Holliday junction DNA helicase RuvA
MIARLRGVLVERSVDSVVVECAGVGYDVNVSQCTLASLGEVGGEVTLRVHTHATENRIALYGFATAAERQVFDFLITVKNVGPSTAMDILSGAPSPQALARTIAAGDVVALVRIKGVGKKTADLLVVELKEKCEWLLAKWGAAGEDVRLAPAAAPIGKPARTPLLDDVASALVHLGWRPAEADKILAQLAVPPGATIETLLRDALRQAHTAAQR